MDDHGALRQALRVYVTADPPAPARSSHQIFMIARRSRRRREVLAALAVVAVGLLVTMTGLVLAPRGTAPVQPPPPASCVGAARTTPGVPDVDHAAMAVAGGHLRTILGFRYPDATIRAQPCDPAALQPHVEMSGITAEAALVDADGRTSIRLRISRVRPGDAALDIAGCREKPECIVVDQAERPPGATATAFDETGPERQFKVRVVSLYQGSTRVEAEATNLELVDGFPPGTDPTPTRATIRVDLATLIEMAASAELVLYP
jgi:hypothetical protein